MHILVTGGAGYIGTHTVIELLQAGYDVTIVDNLLNSQEEAVHRGAELAGRAPTFYKVDLLDYDALEDVFKKAHYDAVIHFAGLKAVGESVSKPLFYYHNNMTGTFNLLKLMKQYGCRNIVFSSSATVYGMPEKVPLDEGCATGALNPYGATKLRTVPACVITSMWLTLPAGISQLSASWNRPPESFIRSTSAPAPVILCWT